MKLVKNAAAGSPEGYRLHCPSCGHSDDVPEDPAGSSYACDQCGCRIAHGAEMPRVFILPHADRRFVSLRLASGKSTGEKTYEHDFTTALERRYAAGIGLDLISTADPALFQEFLVFLAAKKLEETVREAEQNGTRVPSPGADEAVALDH